CGNGPTAAAAGAGFGRGCAGGSGFGCGATAVGGYCRGGGGGGADGGSYGGGFGGSYGGGAAASAAFRSARRMVCQLGGPTITSGTSPRMVSGTKPSHKNTAVLALTGTVSSTRPTNGSHSSRAGQRGPRRVASRACNTMNSPARIGSPTSAPR